MATQPLKLTILNYIESCRLSDGGYFFARVPPSSGLDTYYVVKSLHLLGTKPEKQEKISHFIYNIHNNHNFLSITGIFLTVEILNEIGSLTDEIERSLFKQLLHYRNSAGGFGTYGNLDVEIVSELQGTYRAIKAMKTLDQSFKFKEWSVVSFVNRYLTSDGGYGGVDHSSLATTYYAIEILDLLEATQMISQATQDYLLEKERNWEIYFIEDLFWLVMGLSSMGQKIIDPSRVMDFVIQCQRSSGGFSRATTIGIPTLEYTFYAVSILTTIGVL